MVYFIFSLFKLIEFERDLNVFKYFWQEFFVKETRWKTSWRLSLAIFRYLTSPDTMSNIQWSPNKLIWIHATQTGHCKPVWTALLDWEQRTFILLFLSPHSVKSCVGNSINGDQAHPSSPDFLLLSTVPGMEDALFNYLLFRQSNKWVSRE